MSGLHDDDDDDNALMVLMRPLRKLRGAGDGGAMQTAGSLTKTQLNDPQDTMFAKPKVPYRPPPGCDDPSCVNRASGGAPDYSMWLCPACRRAAPCAFSCGYARRPPEYYANRKPWGPSKRAAWTASANAGILLAYLSLNMKPSR